MAMVMMVGQNGKNLVDRDVIRGSDTSFRDSSIISLLFPTIFIFSHKVQGNSHIHKCKILAEVNNLIAIFRRFLLLVISAGT